MDNHQDTNSSQFCSITINILQCRNIYLVFVVWLVGFGSGGVFWLENVYFSQPIVQ